jgi:hypothetical protein
MVNLDLYQIKIVKAHRTLLIVGMVHSVIYLGIFTDMPIRYPAKYIDREEELPAYVIGVIVPMPKMSATIWTVTTVFKSLLHTVSVM